MFLRREVLVGAVCESNAWLIVTLLLGSLAVGADVAVAGPTMSLGRSAIGTRLAFPTLIPQSSPVWKYGMESSISAALPQFDLRATKNPRRFRDGG